MGRGLILQSDALQTILIIMTHKHERELRIIINGVMGGLINNGTV